MEKYQELKNELIGIAKILEAYPDSLKNQVFELLIDQYLGKPSAHSQRITPEEETPPAEEKPKKRQTASRRESYNLVKDLNLRGDAQHPSFKDFVNDKKPRANIQFNAVALYYLKKIINIDNVTPDHIYTCYDDSKRRPGSLQQSLKDTSGRKYGYIDASNINDIQIPLRGITYVEHDLPASKGKKTES